MLTPSDVLRAAGLGVRLEIDEPLVTDWRARYIDQRRISWEHEQTIERWRNLARRRLVNCRALFGLVVLFGAAGFLVGGGGDEEDFGVAFSEPRPDAARRFPVG